MTEHDNRAVTFDPAQFRVWLDTPADSTDPQSPSVRDDGYLGSAWQRAAGETGWMLESLLSDLMDSNDEAAVKAWAYGAGVDALRVWAVAEPEEGATGGVAGEVVVSGMPLSLGHISERDLVDSEHDVLPGWEAAELMLAELARRADTAVRWYLRVTQLPPGFEGLDAVQIELALQVLAKVWQFSRNGGTPKHVTVTGEQHAAADAVLATVEAVVAAAPVVDGEIV